MTWVPLKPPTKRVADDKRPAVTLRVSKSADPARQKASLTVRPHLLAGGLDWWVPRSAVTVCVGTGEHAGQLRITPGGEWHLSRHIGRNAHTGVLNPPILCIKDLPGMAQAAAGPVEVEFDYSDEWLEVTLPAWARPPAAAKSEVAALTPVPVAKPVKVEARQAYRGVAASTGLGNGVGRPSARLGSGPGARAS